MQCALLNFKHHLSRVQHSIEVLKKNLAVNCQEIWDLEINGKRYSLLDFLVLPTCLLSLAWLVGAQKGLNQRKITLRIVGYNFSPRLTATLNLCLIYFKITQTLAILLEHMHKKFEINRTKIKGSCQSGRKVVTHDSKSDLALPVYCYFDPKLIIFLENYSRPFFFQR